MIDVCKESMCIHCGHFFLDYECAYFGKLYCVCLPCTKKNPLKPRHCNACDKGIITHPALMTQSYVQSLPKALRKTALELHKDWKEDHMLGRI